MKHANPVIEQCSRVHPPAWMRPRPIVESVVCRRFFFGRNRQRGSEGYHGPESAVEAENKLVEVCLQMLLVYTMMDSQQPCIEKLEHCSITG